MALPPRVDPNAPSSGRGNPVESPGDNRRWSESAAEEIRGWSASAADQTMQLAGGGGAGIWSSVQVRHPHHGAQTPPTRAVPRSCESTPLLPGVIQPAGVASSRWATPWARRRPQHRSPRLPRPPTPPWQSTRESHHRPRPGYSAPLRQQRGLVCPLTRMLHRHGHMLRMPPPGPPGRLLYVRPSVPATSTPPAASDHGMVPPIVDGR